MSETTLDKPQNTPRVRLLKSGAPAHQFTDADRKKAVETRRARAAEVRKSFQELIAEKLEDEADLLIKCFVDAAKDGDWRAAAAMIERVLGKPESTVNVQGGDKPVEVEFVFTPAEQQQTADIALKALEQAES